VQYFIQVEVVEVDHILVLELQEELEEMVEEEQVLLEQVVALEVQVQLTQEEAVVVDLHLDQDQQE
jgi:hypothetical protein